MAHYIQTLSLECACNCFCFKKTTRVVASVHHFIWLYQSYVTLYCTLCFYFVKQHVKEKKWEMSLQPRENKCRKLAMMWCDEWENNEHDSDGMGKADKSIWSPFSLSLSLSFTHSSYHFFNAFHFPHKMHTLYCLLLKPPGRKLDATYMDSDKMCVRLFSLLVYMMDFSS